MTDKSAKKTGDQDDGTSSEEIMPIAVAGAVAKAAQDAGVFKALLGPSAMVIGDYWGNRVQEYVEGLEERRERNVAVHYQTVKAIEHREHYEPPKNGPTERQMEALVDWNENAGRIDPEAEPELSALWQSLLSDIFQNDPETDEIRAVLKNMNRADARTLLAIDPFVESFGLAAPYSERFRRLGLVDNRLAMSEISQYAAMTAMTIAAGVATSIASGSQYSQLILTGVVLVISTLAIVVVFRLSRLRLTSLGLKVLSNGLRFSKSTKPTEGEHSSE